MFYFKLYSYLLLLSTFLLTLSHTNNPFSKEIESSRKQDDSVNGLPGVTYALNFDQYSGYLQGHENNRIHYWLVESQLSPGSAPLIIWIGGGPGIPGSWNLMTENGPFRTNPDGETLFENRFSWNKFANVLYLDSPIDTGFSYAKDANKDYNDDTTVDDHYMSLLDFLTVFPEYSTRPLYLAGSSYAAIYIPMLTQRILLGIFNEELNCDLKGILLNNGMLSAKHQVNGAVLQMYAAGLLGKSEYDELVSRCCPSTVVDSTECDFYSPFVFSDNHGVLKAINGSNDWCSSKIIDIAYQRVWFSQNDAYSLYQDCYSLNKADSMKKAGLTDNAFVDYASLMNFISTDSLGGYPSVADASSTAYLNQDSVRKALNIPDEAPKWSTINILMWAALYNRTHIEMMATFQRIMNNSIYKNSKIRILLYNGDTDLTSNHIGAQWFAEELADSLDIQNANARKSWTYQLDSKHQPMTAGYYKSFYRGLSYATIKGSGQQTGLDRAAVTLQLVHNFIMGAESLSTPVPFSTKLAPLLPQYQNNSDCSKTTQESNSPFISYSATEEQGSKRSFMNTDTSNLTADAEKDLISNLPGLTFEVSFRNFAGYLNPPKYPLNHFYYWFVESQHDPVNDPVLLWVDGGPGCSAIGGLFKQNGPYHPNNDQGQTLFENVFSWNKKANVLYIESPVDVGFSYTEDPTYIWNDDTTADNSVEALRDFFTRLFPNLRKNPFFVVGESYGGVYAPTMVQRLTKEIDAGQFDVNFKGMAIASGYLHHDLLFNSEIILQYGRGMNGVDDWNNVKNNCCGNQTNPVYCDYASFAEISECYKITQDIVNNVPNTGISVINMYDDCYMYELDSQQKAEVDQQFVNQNDKIWYGSTDPLRGFSCWVQSQLRLFLRRSDVIEAIHARDRGKKWDDCEYEWPAEKYEMQPKYFDMSDVLKDIMNSRCYSKNKASIVIFNGDIDTLCNFLGDQWFTEKLAADMALEVAYERQPWFFTFGDEYLDTIAGYAKAWTRNLYLLTVKGAGHLIPTDRPMQSLQLINNFMAGATNCSSPIDVDTTPKPLLPQYQPSNCSTEGTTSSSSSPSTSTSTTTTIEASTTSTEQTSSCGQNTHSDQTTTTSQPKPTTSSKNTNTWSERLLLFLCLLVAFRIA